MPRLPAVGTIRRKHGSGSRLTSAENISEAADVPQREIVLRRRSL